MAPPRPIITTFRDVVQDDHGAWYKERIEGGVVRTYAAGSPGGRVIDPRVAERPQLAVAAEHVGVGVRQALDEALAPESGEVVAHLVDAVGVAE